MSDEQNDGGGPAFPVPITGSTLGISARDYFAARFAAAIVGGWIARDQSGELEYADVASAAYAQADAMLRERARVRS